VSKRVLITGASGGIGKATTAELLARGAEVVGIDLRADEEAGVIACDVRDQGAVERAVAQAVEQLGGLDVLINNAGLGTPQSAGTVPDDGALTVIDVNMLGPWRVTSAALPALRESGGRVVNVASGLAHMAIPYAPAYCMSKRGLVAYSDALRLEHGDRISVTTVYPGYIRTPIHDASRVSGVGLEGAVPAEPLEAAARVMASAALDPKARRDVATSRRGAIGYALLRFVPPRVMDRVIRGQVARMARGGSFADKGLASDLVHRLRGQTP